MASGMGAPVTVLDVDRETTYQYTKIGLELKKTCKPIPSNDLWALCGQHSMPLLSRDRHFDVVAGLKRFGRDTQSATRDCRSRPSLAGAGRHECLGFFAQVLARSRPRIAQ